MTEKQKGPKGVGCILTSPTGAVMAHAFDFDSGGYGGFKHWEAQKMRAEHAVAAEYMRHYAYGDLASVIEPYQAREIITRLCRNKGYKQTYINVGHDGVDVNN